MGINSNYDDLFDQYGQQFNVDPQLLKTVFHLESGGRVPSPPSYAGAQGPMQLMPPLIKRFGITDPQDMSQAIPAAAQYLREGLDTYKDPNKALAYYFGGPDTSKWGPRTSAYVYKGQGFYPRMNVTVTPAASQTQTSDDPEVAAGLKYRDLKANPPAQPTTPAPQTQTTVQQQEEPPDPLIQRGLQYRDQRTAVTEQQQKQEQKPPEPVTQQDTTYISPDGQVVTIPKGTAIGTSASTIPAGFSRGVQDVTNPIYHAGLWLAKQAGLVDQAKLDADTAANDASNKKFQADYGDSTAASIARGGGQFAATLPAFLAAGPAAAIAKGIPYIGPAVEAVGAGADAIMNAGGWGGRLGRLALRTGQGGAAGAATGALTTGQVSSDESVGEHIGKDTALGAGAGGLLSSVAAGVRGVVAPWVESRYAQMAQLAKSKFNIDLTVPQMGNRTLQNMGADATNRTFQPQFNTAVAKEMGAVPADNITALDGAAVTKLRQRARDTIENIEKGHDLDMMKPWQGSNTVTDLNDIVKTYQGTPQAQQVGTMLNDVLTKVQNGSIKGADLGQLMRDLRYTRASATDPVIQKAADEIHEALSDGLSATIYRKGTSQMVNGTNVYTPHPDFSRYRRAMYNNSVSDMVEPIVAGSATGDVNPQAMLQAVVNKYGARTVAQAGPSSVVNTPGPIRAGPINTPIVDLARIGQLQGLTQGSNHNSAAIAGHVLAAAAALHGFGGFFHGAGLMPLLEIAGGITGGEAIPRLISGTIGKAYNSPWVARNAINRALNPSGNPLLTRPSVLAPAAATAGNQTGVLPTEADYQRYRDLVPGL